MGSKNKNLVLKTLGELHKNISFDECHKNKTYYDGVKHGIKLSKKTIEEIPKENFEDNNELSCYTCAHRFDIKFKCYLCKRFAHVDYYVHKNEVC